MSDSAPEISTRKHIRGSGLLLAGRFLAIGINFTAQVITVRYLSKSAYGSYTLALTVAMLVSNVAGFGFHTALGRYAPIFREERDWPRLFGSFVFMAAFTLGAGLACGAAIIGASGLLAATWVRDPLTMALLLVFVHFIPVNALDRYFEASVAVFASAKAIFVRRHLIGPGLKLAAVLYVILIGGDAQRLAWCFLAAGIFGVVLYAVILVQALRRRGLLQYFRFRELRAPAGRLFRFGFPVMFTDLNLVARGIFVLFLLEYLLGSEGVAGYRVVFPVAELNKLVSRAFSLMFIPLAAAQFARRDRAGIESLVLHSVRWVTLLTLPVFLATFALAEPITVLLFGTEYAASGPVLAALSAGYFVHAVLSFSALTLKVYERVSWLAATECLATLLACALAVWWIPQFGEFGAAAAVAISVVLQNLATLVALRRMTGVRPFDKPTRRLVLTAIVSASSVWAVCFYIAPPLWVGLPAVVLTALFIMFAHRGLLSIDDTFPELARAPLLRRLIR